MVWQRAFRFTFRLWYGESTSKPFNFGFRVFTIDESNMKDVFYGAGEYSQTMLATMETNIKEDRTDLDLLFGCLLEWGLPLSLAYRSEKIGESTVHTSYPSKVFTCNAFRASSYGIPN